MGARKVGRNDPCPCGSGKKYKHCCLRADRARGRRARAAPVQARPRQADEFDAQLAQARNIARTLLPHVPPKEVQEMKRVLAGAEELAAYRAMSAEIDAAAQVLEEHRTEFEALMYDTAEIVARVQRLFAEPRFVPCRFTVEDVYRAFEAVGYPSRYEGKAEETQAIVDAAILYLADDERREHLARQLMMLVPEYVAAGRFLDGWLIQFTAFQTSERRDRVNAFLFEMFSYGFGAWAAQVEDQKEAILREMGFPPEEIQGANVSADELEARLQAQMADPAKKARLEAFFAEHEVMNAQSEAEAWELERNAVLLLEREDASPLYLSSEEVQPWIAPLLDRVHPIREQALRAAAQGRFDERHPFDVLGDAVIDVCQEMAGALFTPERVARLAEVIRAYRHELLAANESEAAMYAQGALMSLERIQDPAENALLIGICYASLRARLPAFADETRAGAGAGPESGAAPD